MLKDRAAWPYPLYRPDNSVAFSRSRLVAFLSTHAFWCVLDRDVVLCEIPLQCAVVPPPTQDILGRDALNADSTFIHVLGCIIDLALDALQVIIVAVEPARSGQLAFLLISCRVSLTTT